MNEATKWMTISMVVLAVSSAISTVVALNNRPRAGACLAQVAEWHYLGKGKWAPMEHVFVGEMVRGVCVVSEIGGKDGPQS